MTHHRLLLCVLGLLAVAEARPQGQPIQFRFSSSPVYSYRFASAQQTKEESRDALGNVQGSYSVNYPDNGGTLTYSYSHAAQPPAFRTLSDGPLGKAGTIIAIGKNSKDNAFLIEMLEQAVDSRDPPTVTKTDAVIIEAFPGGETPAGEVSSVSFKAASGQKSAAGGGDGRPNQVRLGGPAGSLTRGAFINSKESLLLTGLREESLANEELGARNPPIITDEAIIVEALPGVDGESEV